MMLMISGLALLIEGFAQICRLYAFEQHRTFKTFKYLRNLRRRLWRQEQVTGAEMMTLALYKDPYYPDAVFGQRAGRLFSRP